MANTMAGMVQMSAHHVPQKKQQMVKKMERLR